MTPLTLDPVTPMSNGTPRHRRQASLRVTFADEYQGQVNCSVIYYCDAVDDVTADDGNVTSSVSVDAVKTSGQSVKRSTSTESHDNPFVLDGELQRKADFILQHSTISRHTLAIADPDQLRTVTETADQVRTITETPDPGRVQLMTALVNNEASVVNGINNNTDADSISCEVLGQQPEVLFANGLGPPAVGDVALDPGEPETRFTVENRLRGESKTAFTVENRLGRRGEGENEFTVENHFFDGKVSRTVEIPVEKKVETVGGISEAERARQCCLIQ